MSHLASASTPSLTVEALRPDIVFLDIQIPGLNGLEVARHVPESAHIVFVTAYAEHALSAFDAGAADYLVKPLSAARLLQTVKRLKSRESSFARCSRRRITHGGLRCANPPYVSPRDASTNDPRRHVGRIRRNAVIRHV